jgi:hypothetical protein
MKQHFAPLAVALCFAFAGSAFAADAPNKDAQKLAKDKIEAQYKSDRKACDDMKGNAHEVCEAEAKGKQKVAKAELDAQNKPGPKADAKVKQVRADAEYDLAKAKCEDLKGNAKDACKKDAKVAHDGAKTQAKADKAAAKKS